MAYQEKDFQTDFRLWWKHMFRKTGAFELKVSKFKSIPLSRLERHQEAALLLTKHKVSFRKIPDTGYDQKPYDCYGLAGEPAWVVVMYQTSTQRKEFYMIDIDEWVNARDSGSKSMPLVLAQEVGTKYRLK